jgi:hypothetical protein
VCFSLEAALRVQRLGAVSGEEMETVPLSVIANMRVEDVMTCSKPPSIYHKLGNLLKLASLAAGSMADAASADIDTNSTSAAGSGSAADAAVGSSVGGQQQQQQRGGVSSEQLSLAITCLKLGELAIEEGEPHAEATADELALAVMRWCTAAAASMQSTAPPSALADSAQLASSSSSSDSPESTSTTAASMQQMAVVMARAVHLLGAARFPAVAVKGTRMIGLAPSFMAAPLPLPASVTEQVVACVAWLAEQLAAPAAAAATSRKQQKQLQLLCRDVQALLLHFSSPEHVSAQCSCRQQKQQGSQDADCTTDQSPSGSTPRNMMDWCNQTTAASAVRSDSAIGNTSAVSAAADTATSPEVTGEVTSAPAEAAAEAAAAASLPAAGPASASAAPHQDTGRVFFKTASSEDDRVLSAVASRLQELGAAAAGALPVAGMCGHLGCSSCAELSEQLVVGKGSRCSRCKAAYFCSKDCQAQAWP